MYNGAIGMLLLELPDLRPIHEAPYARVFPRALALEMGVACGLKWAVTCVGAKSFNRIIP